MPSSGRHRARPLAQPRAAPAVDACLPRSSSLVPFLPACLALMLHVRRCRPSAAGKRYAVRGASKRAVRWAGGMRPEGFDKFLAAGACEMCVADSRRVELAYGRTIHFWHTARCLWTRRPSRTITRRSPAYMLVLDLDVPKWRLESAIMRDSCVIKATCAFMVMIHGARAAWDLR